MKPLSEMTIEELLQHAESATMQRMAHAASYSTESMIIHTNAVREMHGIILEARRRDAQPAQWPSGDVAAEQLARAYHEQLRTQFSGLPSFDGLREWKQGEQVEFAAAVLARLQTGAQGVG